MTLTAQAPTVSDLNRYRVSKVYFDGLDDHLTGGSRRDVDWQAVRRGSCQHEIFSGHKTVAPGKETLPIRVLCRKDAQVSAEPVRYGLAVSVEVAPTLFTSVYDEIRDALQIQAGAQAQQRTQIRVAG